MVCVQREITNFHTEFSKIMTFSTLIAVDITYTECYGTLCPNFRGGYFNTQLIRASAINIVETA